MSLTVCLAPTGTLGYLHGGGGHLWVYLNWAKSFQALGCRVVWLEWVTSPPAKEITRDSVLEFACYLRGHGIGLALGVFTGEALPNDLADLGEDVETAAAESDLLVNFRYGLAGRVVERFRRSALVDIDPGLLQIWMTEGTLPVAVHDVYFTIGETVGRPGSMIPDTGLTWHYTPPAVFLDAWPPTAAPAGAPYTTMSNWWGEWLRWKDETFLNDKRGAFLKVLDLPRRVPVRLELALCLARDDDGDRGLLEANGWQVEHAWDVCPTPDDYQRYVRRSRGEFSCAKPSCRKLENAWVSDRTLCYLASGKPAIVEHTGRSRFLPHAEGLFRFRNLDEAAKHLETAEADYDRHCRAGRALAEEYFDGVKCATRILEDVLA